jgi:hypothetical protein
MQAFARNCGNQTLDAKGDAEAAKTARPEYRCQGLGRTDLYERRRPCNRAGAKGSDQVCRIDGTTGNRMLCHEGVKAPCCT